jgi:hypothetical protein
MKSYRASRPSWQVVEAWAPKPELLLGVTVVVGMLLVEVWQSSRMAQQSLAYDQSRSTYEQANARCDYLRATVDRRSTRPELAPMAEKTGLKPAEPGQIVLLPSEYLVADRPAPRAEDPPALLAAVERFSSALVPAATARSRSGD